MALNLWGVQVFILVESPFLNFQWKHSKVKRSSLKREREKEYAFYV